MQKKIVLRVILIEGDAAAVDKVLAQSYLQPGEPRDLGKVRIEETVRYADSGAMATAHIQGDDSWRFNEQAKTN